MRKRLVCFIPVLCFLQSSCFGQQPIDNYGKNPSAILKPAYYDLMCIQVRDPSADSFALRLWTTSIFSCHLITLSRHDQIWEAHKYTYYNAPGLNEWKVGPGIPLTMFVDSLKKMDFDALISQYEIDGFKEDYEDGIIYTLEIMRPGSYKVFQYRNPEMYAAKEINNKRFFDVIWLLHRYFKFYAGN